MKKLISAAVLTVAAFAAPVLTAETLTPAQAKARVEKAGARFKSNNTRPEITRLAYTGLAEVDAQETPMVYVFAETDNTGFYVTPADDRFPVILGFSDEAIDKDNLPPAFVYWMDFYSRQMSWAIENGVADRAAASLYGLGDLGDLQDETDTRDEIPVIVKTRWNQGIPYNNMTPKVSGTSTYTGCVATAMSQAMKANEHPATGVGTYTYSWNNKRLSFNYGETTFDWDNMTNTYGNASTATECEAVATLMYAAGVSVDMSYGTAASGAVSARIPGGLVRNFGYNPGVTYYQRDYFSEEEWDEMVYAELSAGRAIIYDGGTKNNEGHSFICDGFKGGLYHINWGWGGASDGYFRLSALDPDSQGIGGASSGNGFDYDQDMITNISMTAQSDFLFAPLYSYWSTTGLIYSSNTFSLGSGSAVLNFSGFPFDGVLGARLVNNATNEEFYVESSVISIDGVDTSYHGANANFGSMRHNAPAGTYTVYPVCRRTDETVWQPVYIQEGVADKLTLRLGTSGNITTDGSDPDALTPIVSATNVTVPSTAGLGQTINCSVTLHNNSASQVTAGIYILLINLDTNAERTIGRYNINVSANGTLIQNLSMPVGNVDARYQVRIMDANQDYMIISSNSPEITVGNPAGIDDIEIDDDNAPVEYFNLQGVRVDEPRNGLYIRRQGNVTEKVIIR